MKSVLYLGYLLMFSAILMSGNCKKSGGGGNNEPALSVELNPAVNSNQSPSPGPDFPLTVTIKSAMPAAGVKIDVSAKEDAAGATPFFSQSVNTSNTATNFTITGSPRNVTIRVTVTVTSLSNSSNKWTGSYTYSRK